MASWSRWIRSAFSGSVGPGFGIPWLAGID
jgi:hypothetical protein